MAEQIVGTILNVDDNSGSLYAKTRLLRHAGFVVVEAQTGTDALVQAADASPDLILLDIHLPDISGLEVCRRLKSEPTTAHLLVLQISASFVDVRDKTRGLDGGADGYLIEPVEPEELIATVRAFLRLRKAEAALRASEERFRTTFENIAIGMAHVAVDGRWLRVNQRLCEILGYSREELLQMDVQRLTYPADLLATQENLARMAAGELAIYTPEKRYQRKDGSSCWVKITATPQHDENSGTVRYFMTAIEDISERKRAEDRLALMAEISRLLIAPLDYAMILQQVTDRLTPQWADWCIVELLTENGALELSVVTHADPTQIATLHEMRLRLRREMSGDEGARRVARTGCSELYPNVTPEMLRAPGVQAETIQLALRIGIRSVIIVPLQGRNRILGALTLVQCRSQQHFTEQDLAFAEEVARRMAVAVDGAQIFRAVQETAAQFQQLNETLQQQITRRTAELARSQHEFDELAFVAAEDLRTPLRGIRQLASWIDEDIGEQLASTSLEHLQKLRGRTQRMEQLLEDLLTYARIGRREGNTEPVAVASLVDAVVRSLNPPTGFAVLCEGEFPTLVTVRAHLALVFHNLIDNAIKHHDHPETGVVRISAHDQEDFVAFTVIDNGPGIAVHNHQRVFQIFQTLRARDEVEASGMGLPMVKKTVEYYNGTITLDANPDTGCTFRFTWPKS